MPNFTGQFTGKAVEQTSIALQDIPEHELVLSQFTGPQTVSDENWKNVMVTYWGTMDLIQGFGPSRGYFVNEHPNGDRDCGTYRRPRRPLPTARSCWKASGATPMAAASLPASPETAVSRAA